MSNTLPISSYIIEDWFNGFYSATMLVTVWTIVSQKSYSSKKMACMIALVVAMYSCSTMHASLNWWCYSKAINDNQLPSGPGLLYSLTHISPWLEGVGDTFFSINILFADLLFIWRCWVVWQRRLIVIIVPILMTIAGIVLNGLAISAQVSKELSNTPTIAIKESHEFVIFSTSYFALSIATSLLTTILITLRILLVHRANMMADDGRRRNPYSTIIEILVESAALYSVTLLIFIILLVRKNINAYYAQNILAQVAGFAPMLIIMRVAAGHARSNDEWSTRKSSTSNPNPRSEMLFAPVTIGPERSDDGSATIDIDNPMKEKGSLKSSV